MGTIVDIPSSKFTIGSKQRQIEVKMYQMDQRFVDKKLRSKY